MADNQDSIRESDEDDIDEVVPLERKKKMFTKDLRCMMYGFGDDPNPYSESVDLMEDMVVDYVCEMTRKALEVGKPDRVTVDDIIYLIRKDAKKYSRVKDLLTMNDVLKKARKAFDDTKMIGK